MQTTENVYSIGKIKQLIDLNGDSVNFQVDFNVESQTGEPFEILVVDQTTLDNNPKIEYKNANEGKISGTITNDKNVYQNYFLILKADKDIQCKVSISKKELPKTDFPVSRKSSNTFSYENQTEKSINWLKVVIVISIITGFCFFVYKMLQNKNNNAVTQQTEQLNFENPSLRSPSISNNEELLTKMANWRRSPSN